MKQLQSLLKFIKSCITNTIRPFSKNLCFFCSCIICTRFLQQMIPVGFFFSFTGIFTIIWSLITVLMSFQLLANVSSRRWVTLLLTALGLIIYSVSAAYTFGSHDSLNWTVLADNFSIAFTPESVNVILHSLDEKGLQYGAIIFIIFAILEWRYRTISKATAVPLTLRKKLASILIYLAFILLPIQAMDPFLNFVRSGYSYYTSKQPINVSIPLVSTVYSVIGAIFFRNPFEKAPIYFLNYCRITQ